MSIRAVALLPLVLGAVILASPARAGVPAAGFGETLFQADGQRHQDGEQPQARALVDSSSECASR